VRVPLEAEVLRVKLTVDEARNPVDDRKPVSARTDEISGRDLAFVFAMGELEGRMAFRTREQIEELGFQMGVSGIRLRR
jgi:hypothetical protein